MGFERRGRFEWRLKTRGLALGEKTMVMAIVNLTPDSFSGDGLALRGFEAALAEAVAAVDAGADVVDLGGESTRPGAVGISTGEEQERLLPVLDALLRERPAAVVSIDTYHAATARAATKAGAEIVNDVSGLLWDPLMAEAVADLRCGLVVMHTRGRPQEWTGLPALEAAEVVPMVVAGLRERLGVALEAGVKREAVMVDPGFGFGKRGAENLALLAGMGELRGLGFPVLAGLSRKGFLGELVAAVRAIDRLQATVAANVMAILVGAHMLRVHDVQAARESAAIADAVLSAHEF